MICAWIETSSAETGSSQTMSLRSVDHGARDADALALPAGELVRIAVDLLRQQADLGHHRLDPALDLGRRRAPGWKVRSGSAMISPTVMRGLSEASGSWKTICIASRLRPHALRARAGRDPRRARRRGPGVRQQLQHRAPERRLAAAGFADEPERLAGAEVEAHAVDRLAGSAAPPNGAPPRRKCTARSATRRIGASPRAGPGGMPCSASAAMAASSGRSARQRSKTRGQRSLKAQPGGRCCRFGGWPGMVARRRASSSSSRGIEREQPARVGVLRAAEDVAHRPGLDDAARIHHQHAVAEPGDDAEIVGDQDDRRAGSSRVSSRMQLEDLRLHGDVERGRRLVGDQQLRPAEQRHGDHHALAHAAGEFVRIDGRGAARRRGSARARACRTRLARAPRSAHAAVRAPAPRSSAARS